MSKMPSKLSVNDVNSLHDDEFEAVFGNVIELCSDAAKRVKNLRPFKNTAAVCAAFSGYLEEISVEDAWKSHTVRFNRSCLPRTCKVWNDLPPEVFELQHERLQERVLQEFIGDEKLTILKLHPDLAGRLAARGELTKESTNEQRSAGLHELTAAEKKLMDERNQRYKDKFGFPFIICARENKVQSIIAGLQTRYHNSREQEINIGIGEVMKISKLRIQDIMKTD